MIPSMDEPQGAQDAGDSLREKAVKRIKQKRDFRQQLLTYLAVNAFLVAIWAVSGAGFFWPVFPIVGWGLFGIVPHAWRVYGSRDEITEDQIQEEMRRIDRDPSAERSDR